MTTHKMLCEGSIESSGEDDKEDEEDDFVELVENEDEDNVVDYEVVYL